MQVAGGKYGTALQVASFHGAFDIVTLLLENGADPNVEGAELLWSGIHVDILPAGGEYGTALQAAVAAGEQHYIKLPIIMSILSLLLKKGAAPNIGGGNLY
jgi:ankyrin repeat protein